MSRHVPVALSRARLDPELQRRILAVLKRDRLPAWEVTRNVGGTNTFTLGVLRGRILPTRKWVAAAEAWLARVEPLPFGADAAALKTWRTERGLSPTQLAARLRISTSTLYKLERGRHAPRRAVQQRIRRSLGLSLFVGQA